MSQNEPGLKDLAWSCSVRDKILDAFEEQDIPPCIAIASLSMSIVRTCLDCKIGKEDTFAALGKYWDSLGV